MFNTVYLPPLAPSCVAHAVQRQINADCYVSMKSLVRRVLSIVFWACLTPTFAQQPIQNLDAIEQQMVQCIMNTAPDNCLNKLLLPHTPPGNEEIKKNLPGATAFFKRWLDGDTVYAVHPIKSIKVGALHERRIYAVEANGGGFMVIECSFIRLKGKLYFLSLKLSSTQEKIADLFDGRL